MATLQEFNCSGNIVKLSSGTTFPITRALWVGTAAGTATLTTEADQTLTAFPLLLGLNPVRVKGITTALTDVWALY